MSKDRLPSTHLLTLQRHIGRAATGAARPEGLTGNAPSAAFCRIGRSRGGGRFPDASGQASAEEDCGAGALTTLGAALKRRDARMRVGIMHRELSATNLAGGGVSVGMI